MKKISISLNKLILGILTVMGISPVMAQQVDESSALSIASQFIENCDNMPKASSAKGVGTSSSSLSVAYTTTSNGTADYYVINSGNGGFVIVSGDKRTDMKILGYSNSGSFDATNIPENLQDILNTYSKEICNIKSQSEVSTGDGSLDWDSNGTPTPNPTPVVDALVPVYWGQLYPYNLKCPKSSDGDYYPTGCVATAMAQVMCYWKYPERGTGTHKYTGSYGGVSQNFYCNIGSFTFNWDNIPEYYESETAVNAKSAEEKKVIESQQNTVAYLMKAVGMSVDMMYDTDGSGAYVYKIPQALTNSFGYDCSNVQREYYMTDDEWEDMLTNELDNKRPVLYVSDNHCYICDGYDSNNLFHFNLGWGGYANGWYTLHSTLQSAMKSSNHGAIVGIHPHEDR